MVILTYVNVEILIDVKKTPNFGSSLHNYLIMIVWLIIAFVLLDALLISCKDVNNNVKF